MPVTVTEIPLDLSPAPAHTTAVTPPWTVSINQSHHEHPHQRHPAPPVFHRALSKIFQCSQEVWRAQHMGTSLRAHRRLPGASQLALRFWCASDKHSTIQVLIIISLSLQNLLRFTHLYTRPAQKPPNISSEHTGPDLLQTLVNTSFLSQWGKQLFRKNLLFGIVLSCSPAILLFRFKSNSFILC